ncbi:MAG TPA: transcriptional regulator [Acidobacteriota bacterium]|nr:transcriptional regulator [Acidobacteriota bacterium]
MEPKAFAEIRQNLEKTQKQLAQILGVSSKAVQSFEQGWRSVPVHIERQVLLLFALKNRAIQKGKSCWVIQDCPAEKRQNCPAWQFHAGQLCWFINGTFCEGRARSTWKSKMNTCRKCEVYRSLTRMNNAG